MAGGESEPIEADEEETPLEQTVSGAVTALTLLVAFGLMFLGVEFFWVAFVVGFGGVLPMALGAVKLYQSSEDEADTDAVSTDGSDDTADALETLRERYARGELTEFEFERRVEKLVGTESVDDARTYVQSDRGERTAVDSDRAEQQSLGGDGASDADRDRARDLDRELE